MDKDDHKEKSTFQHTNVNQMREFHITDENSAGNLKNILLASMRRIQQESSLQSVSEEGLATSSREQKTFATMTTTASSSRTETTGGNENPTDEDKNVSLISNPMMELGACPIGKTVFAQQQHKQQSSVASSSSSIASTSVEALRKTKTLSFLHNEDLFATGTTMISGGNSSSNSLHNDDKLVPVPTASHLFRSISFQEQRRQKSTSLQRAESGREGGDSSGARKMAILSPKHSLQELNEKIKQQMRVQHQMFSGSSDFSMWVEIAGIEVGRREDVGKGSNAVNSPLPRAWIYAKLKGLFRLAFRDSEKEKRNY